MTSQRSSYEESYKYCTSCGHSNARWRKTCERCNAKLDEITILSTDRPRQRPGCVTVYAALMAIGAILMLISGLILGLSGSLLSQEFSNALVEQGLGDLPLGQLFSVFIPVILIVSFLICMFNLWIAWGLWRLKNWARILVIVFQGLGLLGSIFSMLTTFLTGSSAYSDLPMASMYGTVCATLINLAIGGYIVYWFASHGEYFS